MKRFCSPESLSSLFSNSQSRDTEDGSSRDLQSYSREFQAMLDSLEEEDNLLFEEIAKNTTSEKKRRLSVDQVKALEKNFEAENKLEPERKVKIAQELGLQPRQVAIWFQNRRARFKTKKLEKDYSVLKANYDALKLDYDNLEQERQALTSKVRELKAKLKEKTRGKEECPIPTGKTVEEEEEEEEEKFQRLITSPSSSSSIAHINGSSSSSSCSWVEPHRLSNYPATTTVKMEEQGSVFTAEEPCNFFSVDQAPTLQWYFHGQ